MAPRIKFFFSYLTKSILSGIVLFFVVICFGLGSVRLWLGPELENWLNNSVKVNSFLSTYLTDNYKILINDAQMDWSKQLIPILKIEKVELLKKNEVSSQLVLSIDYLEAKFGLRSFLSLFHNTIIFDDIGIKKLNLLIANEKPDSDHVLVFNDFINGNFFNSPFSFPISNHQGDLKIQETNIIRPASKNEINPNVLNLGKVSFYSSTEFINLNIEKIKIKEFEKVFSNYNFFSQQNRISEGIINA